VKIKKPLLAGKFDPEKAKFPYAATPKIDGIRFLMVDGVALTRSFKPIRNEFLQKMLSSNLPDGIDGELTSGRTFQECSSIMRIKGEPDFKVWIFDFVNPKGEVKLYKERMDELLKFDRFNIPSYEILYPTIVSNQEQIDQLMINNLNAGYEGLMLRDPNGIYKFGRSSVKENILLKVKEFMDDEAEIISFREKMINTNEGLKDNFGRTKRSSCQDGLKPSGTLGGFILRNSEGLEFSCGSGLNDSLRKEIWKNKSKYLGRLVKYKFMSKGIKELPRHPVFIGFRDETDLN
tara:strand:+ start:294 stop:1166 length:873 start_codon:yes stop_codon:yes gene_type:complete